MNIFQTGQPNPGATPRATAFTFPLKLGEATGCG